MMEAEDLQTKPRRHLQLRLPDLVLIQTLTPALNSPTTMLRPTSRQALKQILIPAILATPITPILPATLVLRQTPPHRIPAVPAAEVAAATPASPFSDSWPQHSSSRSQRKHSASSHNQGRRFCVLRAFTFRQRRRKHQVLNTGLAAYGSLYLLNHHSCRISAYLCCRKLKRCQ